MTAPTPTIHRLVFCGLATLCFVALPLVPHQPSAHAQGNAAPQSPSTAPHRIDPQLFAYRMMLEAQGADTAFFNLGGGIDPTYAAVSLRFERPCDAQDVARLASFGAVFERLDEAGLPVGVGHVYRTSVPWGALEQLYGVEHVVFAQSMWRPITLRPLEVTSKLVGASTAHLKPNLGVTGKGALIVDIDSGIDVLHPALFRADGDILPWVDQDKDGVFLPEKDALDYDKDGTLAPGETLKLLDARKYASSGVIGADNRLQASQDWLYLDLNQNGKRDAGPAAFTESTPGYGEPIFVVDDVNRNDALDVGERLVQLKTSVVSKVIVPNRTWTRGVDLIASATPQMLANANHATGVVGIMAGGQFGHRADVGLAPGAEIIVSSSEYDEEGAFLRGLEDAVMAKANVALHEWSDPFAVPHDGSDNVSAAMDAAMETHKIAQVAPVGNMNIGQKHIERPLTKDQPLSIQFQVPPPLVSGGQTYTFFVAFGSLMWTGTQVPTLTLTPPNGTPVTLDLTAPLTVPVGTATMLVSRQITSRNNTFVRLQVFHSSESTNLTQGLWTLEFSDVTEDAPLVGRVTDIHTSWSSAGIVWKDATMDRGTMVLPSSADSAFGVGAYGGKHTSNWDGTNPGELRKYSGWGPRIDGAQVVDITAPDDPYTPLAIDAYWAQQGRRGGDFEKFGGTSGAAPHVAAAMALLIEQDPTRTPQQLYDLLTDHADAPSASFPEEGWGAGKLNVYRALYQEPIPQGNMRPTALLLAQVDTTDRAMPKVKLDATGSTDPEQAALQARFDLDYDGVYETPWGPSLQVTLPADSLTLDTPYLARVQVRDDQGETHGALVEYTVVLAEPPMEPQEGMDMGDMMDAGMVLDMASPPAEQDMRISVTGPDMGTSTVRQDMASGDDSNDLVLLPATPAATDDEGCTQAAGSSPSALPLLLLGLLVGGRRLRRTRAKKAQEPGPKA